MEISSPSLTSNPPIIQQHIDDFFRATNDEACPLIDASMDQVVQNLQFNDDANS